MTFKVCYWDEVEGIQKERDSTPAEDAQREIDLSVKPTEAQYVAAVQALLDAKARERNYDGILSACTYATSTFPKFAAEGQACVAWRDAVWSQCYAILGAVQTGQRAQPTIEQVIAEMPALVWP